ncbi:MAG: TM0106 family RecB-like putative nuclease [Chloroflexota bacterium]
MQRVDGALLFSATDLVDYVACEHLTSLEIRAELGEVLRPNLDDPALQVIARRGERHERRYLEQLRTTGASTVEISWMGSNPEGLRAAHDATVAAMRAGADVIYQAALFQGRWRGYADFLLKRDGQTALGGYGYEVYDTKLSRRAKFGALLQMCSYSELLAEIQQAEPRQMHVVLGDMRVESYRLRDFMAYFRAVKQRFEAAVLGSAEGYPEPVDHCATCTWQSVCDQRRRGDDHLSLVANMRRDQSRKLVQAGITTVAELAGSALTVKVPGIGDASLERLKHQAELQMRQRQTERVEYEVLETAGPGHGLAALPPPSPGDLFFDMEGDPFVDDGGLEYLFGVIEIQNGAPHFETFWAHDHAGEKRAFEQFIDFVMARLQKDPTLHVYHYADYEASALRRLMGRHATREAEVDQLLRGRVLVDLYAVVRQGLRVSQESYSIKKLEPLYMEKRDDAIKDAASSIVAYEQWLETGDQTQLDEIRDYNEIDCISTWKLRNWLEAQRDELGARLGAPLARPDLLDLAPSDEQIDAQARTAELVEALTHGVPTDLNLRTGEQQARWLLAQLLEWHRREDKPGWWAYFERIAATDEDLVEDNEAIGGLIYEGAPREEARSMIHRYRFDPAQEHKIFVGDKPHDPRTRKSAGEVVFIDDGAGILHLKRGKGSTAPHPSAVIPGTPIGTSVLRQAIERVARWVSESGLEGPGPFQAAMRLLMRQPPVVAGHTTGAPLVREGESPSAAARRLVMGLDGSCLPIQGPPGSGKTYTGALMILDLVKAGKKVGICAPTHRAIGHLLEAVSAAAEREHIQLQIFQKAGEGERCRASMVHATDKNAGIDQALATGKAEIVAGTAWLFAREQLEGVLDVLFIDEAGQLSLANTVAIAGAARNLVLLGDPQQLAQPSGGAHPPGADQSAMGHILKTAATMPPELGVLLDTTWRLHPGICMFISDIAYDGRLQPHSDCAVQRLHGDEPLGGAGLRHLPVVHVGNRSASNEEAERVAWVVNAVHGRQWTDQHGRTRPLDLNDVLVVSPYNAHVSRLQRVLPDGARVGTVDKFQGQEAPVVVFSTASSSAEDIPRGLDFLFSLNRLNVAISRARGVAVLITSPMLLQAQCRTPDQMRLLNAFCRYVELATIVTADGPPKRLGAGR